MAVEKNLRLSIKFYKKHCISVTIRNKNNLSNQVAAITYTLEKGLSAFAILLKVCESFLLRKSKKNLWSTLVCMRLLWTFGEEKSK